MAGSSSPYDPSPASLRPLKRMYAEATWNPNTGGMELAYPDPDTLAAAVERGVMFDDRRDQDHDAWVRDAKSAVAGASASQVSEAFVASLGSRRLDLRSALASWVLADRLPVHTAVLAPTEVCGMCGTEEDWLPVDLNAFSHGRFFGTWGPMQQNVAFACFDLEQFTRAPQLQVTGNDVALGRRVFQTLRGLPPETTASAAVASLGFLPGNRSERELLLDVLGVCGILQTRDHPGHFEEFVPAALRELPERRFVDRAYPVCWWRASDGVNEEALSTLLPTLA